MKQYFKHYSDVTRKDLDTVKVGDVLGINDWDVPMVVKGVSENYFVMVSQDRVHYSVCSKLPWKGSRHNGMVDGMSYCGKDDWLFGSPLSAKEADFYLFNNPELTARYLQSFEDGKSHISVRSAVPIRDLYVIDEKL